MDDLDALKWKIGEFILGFESEIVTEYFAMLEMENVFLRKTLNRFTRNGMGYKEMAMDAGYQGDEADSVAAEFEWIDRMEEERYYHEKAIEDEEMLEMLSNERKEERERKWIGISQQSKVRPLVAVWHGGFVEIKHNEEVLIQASYEAFDKASANELIEIINRSNDNDNDG